MSFDDLAKSPLTYGITIFGMLYVVGYIIISMRKSWKRAKRIGYSHEKLKKIVIASVSYTIVPAIGVLVGFFALAPLLGVPLAWWRLSVIGSTVYEIMATNMALASAGIQNIAEAGSTEFVLVMFVMAIGIMGGMIVSPFISKRIQMGTMKIKASDKRWSYLGSSIFMVCIILVFVIPVLVNGIIGPIVSVIAGETLAVSGIIQMLTLFTSFLISLLLMYISKKCKADWLDEFAMSVSMLGAMIMSVVWTNLLS